VDRRRRIATINGGELWDIDSNGMDEKRTGTTHASREVF
jgi:hypothetical protein